MLWIRSCVLAVAAAGCISGGISGCASVQRDDSVGSSANSDVDAELAALRNSARSSVEDVDRGEAWDPSEQDTHDHEGHDHDDHEGHDHDDHEGHDHAAHDDHDHDYHDDAAHDDHDNHDDHAVHEHEDHAGHMHHGADDHSADSWMPSHAPWIALEGNSTTLWNERFGPNVDLVAAKTFGLRRFVFTGHIGDQPGFAHSDPVIIQSGDTIKLVATVAGLEKHGDHNHSTGPLFVYLHEQGGVLQRIASPDAITEEQLDAASLGRFLREEPATFYARHPGKPVSVIALQRIAQSEARQMATLLHNLPSPSVLDALRQSGADVSDIEAEIRDLFARIDPQHGPEGEPIEITVESAGVLNGSLSLVRYSKEIGL